MPRARFQAAEEDSWRCGWPPPDLNDIDGSFARWVGHAEATCHGSEEFAEALFTQLAVETTALALRGKLAGDPAERDACFRAVQEIVSIENKLHDLALAEKNSGTGELAAFDEEFGTSRPQDWIMLPTSTVLSRLSSLHRTLDIDLDNLRGKFKPGVSADKLLPDLDRITAEAQEHRLTTIEAAALLLRADIHIQGEKVEAATAAARAAFNLPRDPQRDLTIGLSALDRVIDAAIASNDAAAISAACGDAIALLERHRYNISAPYVQGAFLQQRARYYTMGMDTAWRIEDFESLIQRADAFKAAGSLRNIAAPANLSAGELDSRFRALSEQIEKARQANNIAAADALGERRRRVWEMLAIARARAHDVAAAPPSLSPRCTPRSIPTRPSSPGTGSRAMC
jgi:hypothetical protein